MEPQNELDICHLYIIEDQKIVSLDLYRQLFKKGFRVIHENSTEALSNALRETRSGIVITNLKGLKERRFAKNASESFSTDQLEFSGTDSVVVDCNMNVIKQFSKPYNVNEIEDFLTKHFTIVNTIAQNHSINN